MSPGRGAVMPQATLRFFMYMSSMRVQLFTAFELAAKVICTFVRVLKSKMATTSRETNRVKTLIRFSLYHFSLWS